MDRRGKNLLKRIVIAVAVVCLSASLSFAGTQGTFSKDIDALRKIHGSFTFAVIGDTRSGGNLYHELILRLMEYNPAFVVNTGDVVSSPDKSHWADFWRQSRSITVPYFLTVGNHDVYDRKTGELFKKEAGLPGNGLYYSFTAGNSLFIFLDSSIPGQDRRITGAQYEWLEKVLSASVQEYKFVFVHHPLYPDKECGHHYGGCLDKYKEDRDRIESLFEKYRVAVVFAGHEHLYLRKQVDGVVHIITGGGGAKLYSKEVKGGFHHFVLVMVSGEEVKGRVIDISGKVRDTFQLQGQE